MLLARPAVSILQRKYELSSSWLNVVKATQDAKQLRLLIGSAPLLYADITRPESKVMQCSNLSMVGDVSLYSENMNLCEKQVNLFGNFHSVHTSGRDSLPKVKLKTISLHCWKYKTRMNVLEGRLFLTGIRWFARMRQKLGTLVAA